jgi:hypothetical protein
MESGELEEASVMIESKRNRRSVKCRATIKMLNDDLRKANKSDAEDILGELNRRFGKLYRLRMKA